ncbi:type VI secretion system baseplate subunit TssG [Rodentibacter caecimuris]|uniref:Type VI secretion protein n=1 Tax=Rodentibacter caecimuris TaxID=1796644 RepID=A0ABX3KZ46_9PAST|nr:type VI secretion protein [Rodentibacter heylii]
METKNISTKYDLNNFGFHQLVEAIATLISVEIDKLDNVLIEDSVFHFSTNPKISFPVGDIEQVDIVEHNYYEKFHIIVNFLGLQGASGPLPGSLLDEIAEEFYENESTQANYLDFFNHHLIGIFHQIWRKYKYYIKFKSDFSDIYSKNILNLMGLSRAFLNFSHLNWGKIFYYVGIIQSGIRTPEVLADIIKYYFELDDVSINEHCRQLVELELEQKSKLGVGNVNLGHDLVAGDKVESFSNKFKINLNNLNITQFYQFLPNSENYDVLKELLRFLLRDPLPYDISLGLRPETQSAFILGEQNSSLLGWTTILKSDLANSYPLTEIIIEGQG